VNTATANADTNAANHSVVSKERWLAERTTLLAREKELMHLQDQVARERRALPWERVDKDYVFDAPEGPRSLADLFAGRRQLLVQHFMFAPGWEQGCPSCSFMADHTDGMTVHLAHRDVSFVAVSRAPLAEIARFKQRMGWQFRWVSSATNDFNKDFHVSFDADDRVDGEVDYNYRKTSFPNSEAPGISVFYQDDAGEIFHTYSTFGRGVEAMMGTYRLLDLVPKGRDEHDGFYKMDWVRHHDRYAPEPAQAAAAVGSCCAAKA
jgi:predicted dithiol-disulfide oxidoreductase (DUF899 family)